MEPLERARDVCARWEEELRHELPPDVEIFDAHTHLGNDVDGTVGRYEELIALMDRYGVSRAFTFCLDERDRSPGFRAGNDRTLEHAARSGGRLIPFVRLALDEEPLEEARRCLDLGARGIKLHPRAQKFLLDDERLAPIFALAAERGVPILIHGGRGLPPIAAELEHLVDSHPGTQLVIAHAGIADLANLAHRFAGKKGVFFDTSVWSAVDLLGLLRLVPPEQVVYASDYPYGQQPGSLLLSLRAARVAGFDERQIRDLLAGNANRIANGEPPLEPSRPRGHELLAQPLAHARIHQYLSMAMPLLFVRQPDAFGALGLALNACEEPNGRREELDRIRELLLVARDLWRTLPEAEDDTERRVVARTAVRLIQMADTLAVTADA
ncbi:MAG: amidohydrolase family protein [Thermoleophilia bacterium]|nr:amidohydrolase family protein [Thermoleophilia bacterium]